jgi:uncharacterized membrane protein (UPF0136 family)
MKKFALPITLFALMVLAGGIMGFMKAQSLPSLIMGLTFGVLLIAASYFVHKEKLYALYTATFSTIALHLFFLYRFFKTFKLMPSGIMVLLSTALGAALLSYLTKRVKETVYQK